MCRDKEVVEVVSAIISLLNNQYISWITACSNSDVCAKEVGKEELWLENAKWEEGKQMFTTSFLGKTTS